MLRPLLLLFIPLAVVAAEPVSRPGVLHLSLGAAMRMALAKNFTLEVERFQPQIARQRVTEELGAFDPVLGITASRGEDSQADDFIARSPLFAPSVHAPFNSIKRSDEISTKLGGKTPLGTLYDFSVGTLNRSKSSFNFDDQYTGTASFGLTQPLLRGAGLGANLAQVRIARTNLQASEWELRSRVIDTLTTTNFVYNELHFAHEDLRAAERSRDLALQLLADNTKRAEVGVMSPLNITTARAEAAARQEFVILAQRKVKDNENLLKQLVTNDLEKMLSIQVEIDPPPSPKFKANVPDGITQALANRPDYRKAVLDVERRHIVLVQSKNQALPRLDLVGSLSLLGLDNDLGTSLDRTLRRDKTEWNAGVIFSVPIPNREGRGQVGAAKLASAQALVNLQRLEQQIVVDVDNASGQIITSRERIESTSEARALALESLNAGEERLRAGTGTTFEVLELQKKLAEAEAAEYRARSDYNKSVSEYYRQTGTSLRVYNVVLE